jgi:hypothetical protein
MLQRNFEQRFFTRDQVCPHPLSAKWSSETNGSQPINSSCTHGPNLLPPESISGSRFGRVAALKKARNLTSQEDNSVSASVFHGR